MKNETVQSPHHATDVHSRISSRYCIDIAACSSLTALGRKGFNLRLLQQSRFPVPPTFVLITAAYKLLLKENGLEKKMQMILNDPSLSVRARSERISVLFRDAPFPGHIIRELEQNPTLNAKAKLWAVRSSSNLEDMPDLSFAGLYDSYLNVAGLEQMVQAIRNCWASLWSERAMAYRHRHGFTKKNVAMAVIIQEMVKARYTGVLFTRDPLSATSDEMILEYCRESGDDLVSGRIAPSTLRLPRNSSLDTTNANDYPDDFAKPEIARLVSLALHVEVIFKKALDIEWAYDGRDFYLLQSRPVTRTSQRSPEHLWTRANIAEVLPGVVSPLTWHIFRATLIKRSVLAPEKPQSDKNNPAVAIKRFHGRVYIRLDSFCDAFCYLPFVLPQTLKQVLGVNFPSTGYGYQPPRGLKVRAAQIYFLLHAVFLNCFIPLTKMGLVHPSSQPAEEVEELIKWNARCFKSHLKATARAIGSFALLTHCLKRWTADSVETLFPLILTGHEDLVTAQQGIAMQHLAEEARKNDKVRDALLQDAEWHTTKHDLSGTYDGLRFIEMFDNFLAVYGARAAGEFELAVPRWREDPSFVLEIIRRFIRNGDSALIAGEEQTQEPSRREALVMVRSMLRHSYQQFLFDRLLASYQKASTLRENLKYLLMEGYAALRSKYLSIGLTLMQKGLLSSLHDIFFLSPSEIEAALSQGCDCALLIAKRKAEHESFERQTAPELVSDNGDEVVYAASRQLSGIGCSPGSVQGTARVITGISETEKLLPGDILVTHHTDPGWTPLFLSCKAVVTEIGGFLSHGATVAREYGIPTVVNVKDATRIIKTGNLIRVDGTHGQVSIIAERSAIPHPGATEGISTFP